MCRGGDSGVCDLDLTGTLVATRFDYLRLDSDSCSKDLRLDSVSGSGTREQSLFKVSRADRLSDNHHWSVVEVNVSIYEQLAYMFSSA